MAGIYSTALKGNNAVVMTLVLPVVYGQTSKYCNAIPIMFKFGSVDNSWSCAARIIYLSANMMGYIDITNMYMQL